MSPGWYLRRLSRMGPREIAGRVTDVVRRHRWRSVADNPGFAGTGTPWLANLRFTAVLDSRVMAGAPADAAARLLATAEELMDGRAEYFGVVRDDLVSPDWSLDPRTGRRAPADAYTFDIPYRDEEAVGDIKQIWEPSRHQHLTVLAAAYARTGDERFAERVADHLKSWWAANPPLRGVHWTSGIELGIRLLSWVWVRRLLDDWPGAAGLFEENPEALHQIRQHQRWLAAFPSRGSSANNHVIAEAAGQLAAACAFDWYPESARWRAQALKSLYTQLRKNTFDSGLNRELATEYHGLVLELGMAAAAEAHAAGVEVPLSMWSVLLRMTDALAAVLDSRLRPPRQGDADDGHGLIVDGAGTDRWGSLLATGDAWFGRLNWWPSAPESDIRTALLTGLATAVPVPAAVGRPLRRPDHFADAGLTILRSAAGDPRGEIWCRCDGGPHGFLSIAAHAHADALSVEVRHDGIDILADPGTYCYHGEPRWRAYFRSTLGHNTLELEGQNQSTSGGPFLWTRHARSRVLVTEQPPEGVARWRAQHNGYSRRRRATIHRRTVEFDTAERELRILDEVREGGPECRLAFHIGPRIEVQLAGTTARLGWVPVDGGARREAVLELPPTLTWSAHRGETDPPLGWYSAGFGRKVPACTLVGTGRTSKEETAALATLLRFQA
ncbi:alginate lyase family protein [Amycolatopsis marina]|nr:alginate lyase family protein [Amycolatopsis marina]